MKIIVVVVITFFFFHSSAFSQNQICPTISVTGPSGYTRGGDFMTFVAHLAGENSNKITYNWSVSNGEIGSGQGTSTINIQTIRKSGNITITATVEIGGLPSNCPNVASANGDVFVGGDPIVDGYGRIRWIDEQKRLDSIAVELNKDRSFSAVFIFYISGNRSSYIFKKHSAKIKKYLFDKHNIQPNQMEFVFGGNRDFEVMVYLLPIEEKQPSM